MNWLTFFTAVAKLAAAFADWLRARTLLTAGEAKGRAESDAAHARAAEEQARRMREIAASKATRTEIEKRLEEGSA